MNREKSFIDNILQESNKEKQIFTEKMKKYLSGKSFYGMSIEEKTNFLLTEKGIKTIMSAAKQNLSLVEIGKIFDISQRAFIDMRNSNPAIYDAFDLGYAQRDNSVIDAMYKLAQGFYVEEEEEHEYTTANGRTTNKVIKKKKYIPPNVYAGQYIANNRKQYEYKRDTDKNSVPESNKFSIDINFQSGEDTDE